MCAINVLAPISVEHAQPITRNTKNMMMTKENQATNPPDQNETDVPPPPTPICVKTPTSLLSGYSDSSFVCELRSIFRQGARIGFQGQRTHRFSKNLPTLFQIRLLFHQIWLMKSHWAVWAYGCPF